MMKIVFRLRLLLLFILAGVSANGQKGSLPYVVLVSFDGFRYDYVEKYNLPNFKSFIKDGAGSEGIIPCFPSMTFPNHYSIVTGMYPGNHGLVDNQFYDTGMNREYRSHDSTIVIEPKFYGGKPIWKLARENGIKSASFFWVGSEQSDPALRPDYTFRYNSKIPFQRRIDQVIEWLRLPENERPHFIALYFSEPDHDSHDTGPWSDVTKATLLRMDTLLGKLMTGIRQTGLPVNTILVSDHGMREMAVEPQTYIYLDELMNLKDPSIRVVNGGTLAHVYLKNPKRTDSLYSILKQKEKNFHVYRQRDFPERWHYQHVRSGDILILPAPNNLLRRSGRATFEQNMKVGTKRGDHGFDPGVVADMKGIFYANGPNIKAGVTLPAIRNIEVYPLIAQILGLKTPAIDGNFKALKPIYRK